MDWLVAFGLSPSSAAHCCEYYCYQQFCPAPCTVVMLCQSHITGRSRNDIWVECWHQQCGWGLAFLPLAALGIVICLGIIPGTVLLTCQNKGERTFPSKNIPFMQLFRCACTRACVLVWMTVHTCSVHVCLHVRGHAWVFVCMPTLVWCRYVANEGM